MESPQTPARKSPGKKIILYGLPVVILLTIIIVLVFKLSGNKTTAPPAISGGTSEAGNTEVATATTMGDQSVFDPEPGPAPHTLTPAELRQSLEREIAASDEPYHEPENAGTVGALHPKTIRYVYWAQLVGIAEASSDPAMKSLARSLKDKLREHQLDEFPRMRKRYAEISAMTLSHSNVIVEIHGSRNDEIYFIANVFNDHGYVRSFHNSVIGYLRQYRFREARYFTQPGVETDRFQPSSQPDSEIHETH